MRVRNAGARLRETLLAHPMRPAITALFASGCVFWAACAAAYTAGMGVEAEACYRFALMAAATCLVTSAVCALARRPKAAIMMAALLIGACLGFGASANVKESSQVAHMADWSDVELVLEGDTRDSAHGEVGFARAQLAGAPQVTVYADFGDAAPMLDGQRLRVSATYAAGSFPKDEYLWQHGAVGRVRVRSFEEMDDTTVLAPLRSVREGVIRLFDPGSDDVDAQAGASGDARALLQAVVCGYRHDIAGTRTYAGFQACGMAHLVAVSGAHLAIVVGLVAQVLRALRVCRRVAVFALMATMGSYLVVSGFPVSAMRAAVMASTGLLSFFGERRPSSQNALGLGMFLLVGTSPAASVSASFALSALSTAGIVVFGPLVQSWARRALSGKLPGVADALALTLAANMLSQPYACALFNQLPVIGPLANVICAPLFAAMCTLGFAIAVLGMMVAPLASVGACFPVAMALVLDAVVNVLAHMPFASVPIAVDAIAALAVTAVGSALLWVLWPRLRLRVVAPLAVAVTIVVVAGSLAASAEDAIVMLDVGQGDAFLVKSRGATLLVDTGNKDGQLLEQLARCATMGLDAVLVTHSDDDHCGSLDALERGVHVSRAIVAEQMLSSGSDKNKALVEQARRTAGTVVGVERGDVVEVGAFRARVVWPERFVDDGGNADSLCLLLEYDGDADGSVDSRALFTGDAESEQVARMIESGDVSRVDVLKVGHHGSKDGLTDAQLDVLAPRIALIGVGEGNRYGHPAAETLAMLDTAGCRVFRSDVDGQVKCVFGPDSITVVLQ